MRIARQLSLDRAARNTRETTLQKAIVEILEDHVYLTVMEIMECLQMRREGFTLTPQLVYTHLIILQEDGKLEHAGYKVCGLKSEPAPAWSYKEGDYGYDLSRYEEAAGRIGTKDRGTGRYGSGYPLH